MVFPAVNPPFYLYLQPFLWILALCLFFRAKGHVVSVFFGIFLVIRAFVAFALADLFVVHGHTETLVSSYIYWVGYFLGFVALLCSFRDIYRHAISPFPGLIRISGIIFRWAIVVSFLIACAVMLPSLLHSQRTGYVAVVLLQTAAGFCALELCLLAFLIVAIRAMGFSGRNRIFGICAGLVIMATGDFTIFSIQSAGAYSWSAYLSETATILSLSLWMIYFVLPEPARKPEAAPMNALLRWNDFAVALGHPQEPPQTQSGFLHDVENMVDRVLAKNAAKTQ